MTAPHAPGTSAGFTEAMTAAGTPYEVARELERRIEVIETDESGDASREPWTGGELLGYVLVSVAAVAVGVLVVLL